MRFHIEKMSCGGCVKTISAAIRSVDPQAEVDADLSTRRITVTSDRPSAPIMAALTAAGYPARLDP